MPSGDAEIILGRKEGEVFIVPPGEEGHFRNEGYTIERRYVDAEEWEEEDWEGYFWRLFREAYKG